MSRIATCITINFTSFIDFFFIILMLICVYYFLIDLNYRNIQSTNSTDLHGRCKTKCNYHGNFYTENWLFLLCKVKIDNKYNIPVRIFPGGGGAVDNLDPQMVSFFLSLFVLTFDIMTRKNVHFFSL